MTLYWFIEDWGFRKVVASQEHHEIKTIVYQRRSVHCIGLKGSGFSTDLRQFFRCRETALEAAIDACEDRKHTIDCEIDYLLTYLELPDDYDDEISYGHRIEGETIQQAESP